MSLWADYTETVKETAPQRANVRGHDTEGETSMQARILRRGVTGGLAAVAMAASIVGCGGASRPAAPRVGDHCTDNGAAFTYNDGGPGWIEQTAFGLTCQAPAPPARSSATPPPIPAGETCIDNGSSTYPYAGEAICSWYR